MKKKLRKQQISLDFLLIFLSSALFILWAHTHIYIYIVRPSLWRCTHKEYSQRFSMNNASLVLCSFYLCLFWKETSYLFVVVVISLLLFACMRIDIDRKWFLKNHTSTSFSIIPYNFLFLRFSLSLTLSTFFRIMWECLFPFFFSRSF